MESNESGRSIWEFSTSQVVVGGGYRGFSFESGRTLKSRLNDSRGSAPQARAQAMNSAISTLRFPDSQLKTQLCGLPRRFPKSR
jgi:hypothetical protein